MLLLHSARARCFSARISCTMQGQSPSNRGTSADIADASITHGCCIFAGCQEALVRGLVAFKNLADLGERRREDRRQRKRKKRAKLKGRSKGFCRPWLFHLSVILSAVGDVAAGTVAGLARSQLQRRGWPGRAPG